MIRVTFLLRHSRQRGGASSRVQADLVGVQQICGSFGAFAALRDDGTVVTWGNAQSGGDCSSVRHLLKDVVEIYA